MNGEERRNKIIDYIEHSPVPVSGTALANHFSVSRQAVVQDIALLRASGNDILSTNRGYVIAPKPKVFTRTFKVSHSDDQTADELSLIVDLGGKVLNVFVDLSKKNRHVQMPICHKRNYPSTHLDSNNIEKVGFLSQGRSLTKFIESKFLASNSTWIQ